MSKPNFMDSVIPIVGLILIIVAICVQNSHEKSKMESEIYDLTYNYEDQISALENELQEVNGQVETGYDEIDALIRFSNAYVDPASVETIDPSQKTDIHGVFAVAFTDMDDSFAEIHFEMLDASRYEDVLVYSLSPDGDIIDYELGFYLTDEFDSGIIFHDYPAWMWLDDAVCLRILAVTTEGQYCYQLDL